ncbi:MAG TPA: anti-sigma factor antagonist [Crocinitomicaceae bacterium]|nr:anti-sigma factor antagonist [Crocinitomicaceae bacterium]
MNLTYQINIEDPVIIYELTGKITTDDDYLELEKIVFDYLNQNYYRIVFDLTQLTHTNSSGIGFFMRTLTKSRIMGGELVLTGVTGNVEKIFAISKLNEIYTICENQKEAINQFKQVQ